MEPNRDKHERRNERLKLIREDLQRGQKVTDFRFDQVYPLTVRKLSQTHWTPVQVAIRAANLIVSTPKTRVLDVGSGCGKFCTVGALASQGQFIGVENRPELTEIARNVALELGAANASFIQGNMMDLDWSLFDAFYFFNPFFEDKMNADPNTGTPSPHLERFNRHIEIVKAKLRTAKAGTRVATYHGFGGDMPVGYHNLRKEPIGTSYLELWIKIEIPKPVSTRMGHTKPGPKSSDETALNLR